MEGGADIEPPKAGGSPGARLLLCRCGCREQAPTVGSEASLERLWILLRRWGFLRFVFSYFYLLRFHPTHLDLQPGSPASQPIAPDRQAPRLWSWDGDRRDETCLDPGPRARGLLAPTPGAPEMAQTPVAAVARVVSEGSRPQAPPVQHPPS